MDTRAAAIAELFAALEALVLCYRDLPDGEWQEQCSADAYLIPGEIARRLAIARARLLPAPATG